MSEPGRVQEAAPAGAGVPPAATPRSPRTVRLLTLGGAAVAGGAAALLAAAVAGGTAAPPAASPTVTVTVTASVPAPPTTPGEPTDDASGTVHGRTHDVGTVVGFARGSAALLLTLDRWSVVGVSDAVVSRDGVPLVLDRGDRFRNANTERTYTVVVDPRVTVVLNVCEPAPATDLAVGDAVVSRPLTMEAFLARGDRSRLVTLLTYRDDRLIRLETSPRC